MADAADVENLWTIAYVGVGNSKKDEYLIINRGSCKWLNASGDYTRTDCKAHLSLGLTQRQDLHPPGKGS
jgi:hypothetical protein